MHCHREASRFCDIDLSQGSSMPLPGMQLHKGPDQALLDGRGERRMLALDLQRRAPSGAIKRRWLGAQALAWRAGGAPVCFGQVTSNVPPWPRHRRSGTSSPSHCRTWHSGGPGRMGSETPGYSSGHPACTAPRCARPHTSGGRDNSPPACRKPGKLCSGEILPCRRRACARLVTSPTMR